MGYNKENYARIRKAYQVKYLKAYAEAERRTEELHAKSPTLAEIDRKLSAVGAEIAMVSLWGDGDVAAKVAGIEAENKTLQEKRAALLAEMGYPADYTVPPYECPLCKDSGFVGTQMCDCMRKELIMAAYETSGLGALMQKQSFESFDLSFYQGEQMKGNVAALQAYAEGFSLASENLILCGPTGLGKTHLSTAVARRIIERGYDVLYTSAIDMFSDFERARFGTGEERREAGGDLARYTDCDLLILDDLGTETANQFTTSCLYAVLNNRINLHRPTVINTNLVGKEIMSRYADRITSRLFGEFRVLSFAGTDIRRQKLNRK